MDTVPQMISTKDFAYLSDMFEWNYNAWKQINHFMEEVEDENIKDLLESFRNMHYDHMEFIISILKQEEYKECDCEECECEEDDDEEEEEEYDDEIEDEEEEDE